MANNFEYSHQPRTEPEVHEKPKRIRIIKTPEGVAPENIRREWIGVEIELAPADTKARYHRSVDLGTAQVANGYEVLATEAIAALAKKCNELNIAGKESEYESAHKAWQVWLNSSWNKEGVRFLFNKGCCELIS